MTLLKYTGLAILAVSFPLAAKAQDSGTYGAIGAATYDFDTYGVDLKLGHNFNENFGIEAQGIIGLTSDSTPLCSSPSCATFKQKTDYTIGVARGGIHHTKSGFTINNALNTDFSSDDTGVAVGAGLQYNFSEKNAIRLETTYLDNVDSQTSVISFVRKF